MQLIENITSAVKQKMTLLLENNEKAEFKLHYNGRMQAWFFSFTYKDISISNLKVCLHPNILRQFRNIIPFGISFVSNSLVEPFQDVSFSKGICEMYLLTQEEVIAIEEEIYS